MKKEYIKMQMVVWETLEDTVRTSGASDEGRGVGLDYFVKDDFQLLS